MQLSLCSSHLYYNRLLEGTGKHNFKSMFTSKELIAFSAILRVAACGEQSYPTGKPFNILLEAYERFSISPEMSNQSAQLSPREAFIILHNMDYSKRKIVFDWINEIAACDTVGSFRYKLAQNVKKILDL